jgi:tetratricopeptide (TPR) repeat protein
MSSTRHHCLAVVALLVLVVASPRSAADEGQPEGVTREFIDQVWSDHLMLQASKPQAASAQAEGQYRLALRLKPGHKEALLGLVRLYGRNEDWVMAAMAAMYGQDIFPDDDLFRAIEDSAAVHLPEKEPRPGDELTTEEQLEVLYEEIQSGDTASTTGVEGELRRLLAGDPRNPRVLMHLATLHLVNQEWPMCAMVNRYAAEVLPDKLAHFENLATSYDKLGLDGPALDTIGEGLELQPANVALVSHGARLAHEAAEEEMALAYYERWIELEPRNPRPHLGQGVLFYDTGEFRKAKRSFVRTAEISASNPIPPLYLAKMAAEEGEFDTAMAWLKKLAALVSPEKLAAVLSAPPFSEMPDAERLLQDGATPEPAGGRTP